MNFEAYIHSKLIHPDKLREKSQLLKQEGKTLVTLNGSFDLLHAGHLQIIYDAACQGDILIIGLNSDQSIQKYKSLSRPIIPLEKRMQMMASLAFVDYVTSFDEVDPIRFIETVCPDVHVNGAEYGKDCVEAKIVSQVGARLHLTELKPNLSTTQIIETIRNVCV